jgi:hypothetical protein
LVGLAVMVGPIAESSARISSAMIPATAKAAIDPIR